MRIRESDNTDLCGRILLASVARWTRRDVDDKGAHTDRHNTRRQAAPCRASAWLSGSYPWHVPAMAGVFCCTIVLLGVLYKDEMIIVGLGRNG